MHWATRSLNSGAGQLPAQILTAPSIPLSAVSNFAQMYDEDSSGMLASLKKVGFEEARRKGPAPKDPEAWWDSLTEDQRRRMEDEAGQKALVSAIPNAALETIADRVLIGKLPLPAKLEKAILVWRKSNPRLALGARVGASVLGKSLSEGSMEAGEGLISDISRGVQTGDKVNVAKNIGPNFVGGLGGALAATPLSVHEALGEIRAENIADRLREKSPAPDSAPSRASAAGNTALAPSTSGPVNVEQPPGKVIKIGTPASQASDAGAAETESAAELSPHAGQGMASGNPSPAKRIGDPVAEGRGEVRELGEEGQSERTREVPSPLAGAVAGRTLAIKQTMLEEERSKVLEGIAESGPETTVGRVLLGRLRELDSEISKVRAQKNSAIRSLLKENNPGSPVVENGDGTKLAFEEGVRTQSQKVWHAVTDTTPHKTSKIYFSADKNPSPLETPEWLTLLSKHAMKMEDELPELASEFEANRGIADLNFSSPKGGFVEIPAAEAAFLRKSPGMGEAIRLAALFGRRIVIFRNSLRPWLNGGVNPRRPELIFISADSFRPYHTVVGHELWEHLRLQHPELAEATWEALAPDIVNFDEYRKKKSGPDYEDAAISQELIADFLGDSLNDPKFWDKLSDRNPTFFQRFAEAVKAWLDGIASALQRAGFQTANTFATLREHSQFSRTQSPNLLPRTDPAR